MKICSKCGVQKSVDKFYKFIHGPDGLQSHCKSCANTKHKEYCKANLKKIRVAAAKWHKANPRTYDPAWYKANSEKIKANIVKWQKANPGKVSARVAAHHASKLQRTPSWANLTEIEKIYIDARNSGMHVDHIIPLRGKLVSGLHVPTNLQLLLPIENMNKSNKFDIV